MITLITGSPGAGKTLSAISELIPVVEKGDRPLFVAGIPSLDQERLTHCLLDDPLRWHEIVPDGALVVVDECQTYWRPRGSGSTPPASIQQLETHRHKGIDFVLITQSPMLVDANIRRLVTRHVHYHSTFAGRWSTEWAECQSDPTRLGNGIRTRYNLPKRAMSLYKSAEVHTKVSHKKPKWLYVLPLLVLVFAGLVYTAVNRISSKANPQAGAPVPAAVPGTSSPVPSGAKSIPRPEDYMPRIEGRPETAPLYDDVRTVSSLPRLTGCISSASKCFCYTQQATIYDVPQQACRLLVLKRRFDPYLPKAQDNQAKGTSVASAASPAGERQRPGGGAAQVEPPMLGGGKPFVWEKGIH